MIPAWLKVAGVAAAGFVGYQKFKKPILQSLRSTAPDGSPIQVIVPTVLGSPTSGVGSTQLPAGFSATRSIKLNLHLGQKPPHVIANGNAAPMQVRNISDAQKALNALGFANPVLTVDGKLGPLTSRALANFQASVGMPGGGGKLDNATELQLELALAKLAATKGDVGQLQNVVNPNASVASIVSNRDVQHALNLLGASPALTEDGKIGPKSIAAIKAFQITHGLVSDGVAGPKTKAALQVALSQAGFTEASMTGEGNWQHTVKKAIPFGYEIE